MRDKIYCEEVEEFPDNPEVVLFDVGCDDSQSYLFFVCSRNQNLEEFADWLADKICADCTHMCPAAQKRFDCDYQGQDFTAIARLNAEFMDLFAEDTAF